jgi:DNA end-binding protein Ku
MAEVLQLGEDREEESEEAEAKEADTAEVVPRTVWSGSLRMGLVNIPVRAVSMTRDRHIRFRMIHRECKTPISFKRFCQEGKEVPMQEILYGYKLERNRYVLLEKKELDEVKPESSDAIVMDRFVSFFSADPHYFDRTYLLLPDKSEAAYSLLRTVMEETGKAALGRMTMRSKEKIALVHFYQNALVATTLRYPDEVLSLEVFRELSDLPVPDEREMVLARQIVDGLSGDLDLSTYRDLYREKLEELIQAKMGEFVPVAEKKRERPPAKSLMEALRMTAESLK